MDVASVALDQSSAPGAPEQVAEVVSDDRGCGRHCGDDDDIEVVRRPGVERGGDERRFTGQRDPDGLQAHEQDHGKVAVRRQEVGQRHHHDPDGRHRRLSQRFPVPGPPHRGPQRTGPAADTCRGGNMQALSGWVMRHRLVVGLLWLAITVIGLVIAPSVSGRLKSGVQVNSAAYTANQQIARHYGGATSAPGLVTIDLPAGQTVNTPAVKSELAALDAKIATALPTLREVSFATTASPALVGTGGTSTLVLVYPPHDGQDVPGTVLDQLNATAKATVAGATVHTTGVNALAAGNASTGHSSVLTELLIGALGALLVLALVFGSFLALLPLIMALISVLTMQLIIYALTYLMPSSSPINPAVQYI